VRKHISKRICHSGPAIWGEDVHFRTLPDKTRRSGHSGESPQTWNPKKNLEVLSNLEKWCRQLWPVIDPATFVFPLAQRCFLASSHPSYLLSPQRDYIPWHNTGKQPINSYDFLIQVTMSTCVSHDQCLARVRIIQKEMSKTPISFLPHWIAPITSSPPIWQFQTMGTSPAGSGNAHPRPQLRVQKQNPKM